MTFVEMNTSTQEFSLESQCYQKGTLLESQWLKTLDVINLLVKEHESKRNDTCDDDRTWNSWMKPVSNGCSNTQCLKAFGLFARPHYCKRCGAAFCKQCLSCERQLEIGADPDPTAVLEKVCLQCFNQEEQTIGQTRCLFNVFLQFHQNRNGSCLNRVSNDRRTPIRIQNFRDNLDLDKECLRLRKGFKESLRSSLLGIVFKDVLEVQMPEWKKSAFWVYGNMADKCYGCHQEFGLRRGRHNCVVCGSVVCGDCSMKDLLVYIPDGQDAKSDSTEAELSIIRIIGCPEKEPQVCSYLWVCQMCNRKLQDRQVSKVEKDQKLLQGNPSEDFLLHIAKANEKLKCLKDKIEDSLQKYSELLEMLDVGSRVPSRRPGHRSNMQTLAKAQSDLSDYITDLVTTIFEMKKLRPSTKRQLKILNNIILSKSDSYHEYVLQFRKLRGKLEDIAPKDVLREIQTAVNRNAINSCYLSIKQLALEVLHLSDKHNLNMELLCKLITAEEIAQKELKSALNESWSEQEQIINRFLEMQLKDHRFIRPSRRLLCQHGNNHVQAVILERSEILLQQIFLQLTAKSSASEFPQTKDALKQLMANDSLQSETKLLND